MNYVIKIERGKKKIVGFLIFILFYFFSNISHFLKMLSMANKTASKLMKQCLFEYL